MRFHVLRSRLHRQDLIQSSQLFGTQDSPSTRLLAVWGMNYPTLLWRRRISSVVDHLQNVADHLWPGAAHVRPESLPPVVFSSNCRFCRWTESWWPARGSHTMSGVLAFFVQCGKCLHRRIHVYVAEVLCHWKLRRLQIDVYHDWMYTRQTNRPKRCSPRSWRLVSFSRCSLPLYVMSILRQ